MSKLFTTNSWLNKWLMKWFNKRIILQRGIFYIQRGVVQCKVCHDNITVLPRISVGNKLLKFGYQLEPQLDVECQVNSICDDIQLKGWIIQYRFKSSEREYWSNHWNHKIYNKREDALDALNQTLQSQIQTHPILRRDSSKYDFRIFPLYEINQDLYRKIQIQKIIQ